MSPKIVLALLLSTMLGHSALAAPAPWFKWSSPEADYQVCAQFSPGEGWRPIKGPFEDSACRKPLRN